MIYLVTAHKNIVQPAKVILIEDVFHDEPILVVGKIMTTLLMIAILVLRVFEISRVLRGSTRELPLVGKYVVL